MPSITRRQSTVILLGLLVLGAYLRFSGIDYGLPHPTTRPDEERIVGRAYHILATGDFHLVTFTYPGLIIYLEAFGLWTYASFGQLAGWYEELSDFLLDVVIYRPGLEFRICRSVSALLATATIWMSYRLARESELHRSTSLIAASVVATAYLHVRDSHFATVDVGMTFFVALGLLFAVRAGRRQRLSDFALAGFASGLAVAAKYNAGVVLAAVFVAALLSLAKLSLAESPPARRTSRTWLVSQRLLVAGAATIVAFVLASPYNWLNPQSTIDSLTMIRTVLYDAESPRALWTHLSQTFPIGYGWAFTLLGFAGVVRALSRRRYWELVLLGFVLPTLWTISTVRWTLPRYLIPLIPPLAVFASAMTASLIEKAYNLRRREADPTVVVVLLLISLTVPGAARAYAFNRVAAQKDTRVMAAEWANERLPPRSAVSLCRGYGAPQLNTDRRRARPFKPELVGCDVSAADTESPYLITHEHPQLPRHSKPPVELLARLRSEAEELAVFRPYRMPYRQDVLIKESLYYDHDAFYIPFAGLGYVERGGPTIRIWKLPQPRPRAR